MASVPFQPGAALAPLDSTRVVAEVYSVSLLAVAPIAVAVVAAVILRGSPAGMRALVWRTAIVSLLVLMVAQLLPAQWVAWVVPSGLADPLIELGRMRVAGGVLDGALPSPAGQGRNEDGLTVLRLLSAIYWAGVTVVGVSTVNGWRATRMLCRRATPVRAAALLRLRDRCAATLGISRAVPLSVSDDTQVPIAMGVLAPRVILPGSACEWPLEHQRAALLHELAHVRVWDVGFRLISRLVCALLWFHPCSWWMARRLREESELACDDRVLLSGVRASDYASLLLRVADAAARHGHRHFAPALAGDGGIRRRLAMIIDPVDDRRAPGQGRIALVLATASSLALVLGLVELAPTHGVLRRLMHDARWESRAFAVLGLAPRADSVAVARAAAATDPDPNVRAWASFALGAGDAGAKAPAGPGSNPLD